MTRATRKMTGCEVRAAATALLVALAAVGAAPAAHAGGTVGVTITPRGELAEVLSTGLSIYSLVQSRKSRAKVDQRGAGNAAGIAQSGSGNFAKVVQRGRGHTGTISQNGDNNAFTTFQFGRRTTSHVTQSGNGNVGLGFQFGW